MQRTSLIKRNIAKIACLGFLMISLLNAHLLAAWEDPAQQIHRLRDRHPETVFFFKMGSERPRATLIDASNLHLQGSSPEARADSWISELSPLLALGDSDLEHQSSLEINGSTIIRYQQSWNGLEVWNSSLVVELRPDNRVLVYSDLAPSEGFSRQPLIQGESLLRGQEDHVKLGLLPGHGLAYLLASYDPELGVHRFSYVDAVTGVTLKRWLDIDFLPDDEADDEGPCGYRRESFCSDVSWNPPSRLPEVVSVDGRMSLSGYSIASSCPDRLPANGLCLKAVGESAEKDFAFEYLIGKKKDEHYCCVFEGGLDSYTLTSNFRGRDFCITDIKDYDDNAALEWDTTSINGWPDVVDWGHPEIDKPGICLEGPGSYPGETVVAQGEVPDSKHREAYGNLQRFKEELDLLDPYLWTIGMGERPFQVWVDSNVNLCTKFNAWGMFQSRLAGIPNVQQDKIFFCPRVDESRLVPSVAYHELYHWVSRTQIMPPDTSWLIFKGIGEARSMAVECLHGGDHHYGWPFCTEGRDYEPDSTVHDHVYSDGVPRGGDEVAIVESARKIGALFANALETAIREYGVDRELLWKAMHWAGWNSTANILQQGSTLLYSLERQGASGTALRAVCTELTHRGFDSRVSWDTDGNCLFETRIPDCTDDLSTPWDECLEEEVVLN